MPKYSARVALVGAADTAGGVGAWVNLETKTVWVDRVLVTSSHIATAACTLDVGATATDATTLSDNLIDGLDLHSALLTGNDNFTDPGANGKDGAAVAPGKWITFSTASGAAAGFVGTAYIEGTIES